jgi:hypothetical protein
MAPSRGGNRRVFRFRSAILGLLAAVVALLSLVGSDSAYASINFEPQAITTVDDPAPGANSDLDTIFCIDFQPGCTLPEPLEALDSSNFSTIITFTPPEFAVAAAEDMPLGALLGWLTNQATLGILNGPCSPQGLTPQFNMVNSTTNVGGPLVSILDDGDFGFQGEIYEDDDFDGLPNGVEMYPDFLTRIFPGPEPRVRLYGQTSVIGLDVALNMVIFEPGTQLQGSVAGPIAVDPALGYPTVIVLLNEGDPEGAQIMGSPVTDFCTPLKSTFVAFGLTHDNPNTASGGGAEFLRNPAADTTVNFTTFAVSQPDADADGLENGFDTCPYAVNQENPRLGGDAGDPDYDGIDSSCDPDPETYCGPGSIGAPTDCDGDYWPNRGDNCPLASNIDQSDADFDEIGDVCDIAPAAVDGELTALCIINTVDIGAGGGAPPTADDYLCTPNQACLGAGAPPPPAGGDAEIVPEPDGVCNLPEGESTPTPTPIPTAAPKAPAPTPTPAPTVLGVTQLPNAGSASAGGPLDTWHLVLASIVGAVAGLAAGWYAWRT